MVKINQKQHITKSGQIKRNPVKIPYKKTLVRDGYKYTLGLVNDKYLYYDNADGEALVFDKKMNIVSDGYGAEEDYILDSIKALKTGKYVYFSKNAKFGAKENYSQDPEGWDEEMK